MNRVIKAIIAHKDNNEKYRRKDSFLFRFILKFYFEEQKLSFAL